MIKVARAFSKSPDEVRFWKLRDFTAAQADISEIPPIEALFKAAFLSKGNKSPSVMTIDEFKENLKSQTTD